MAFAFKLHTLVFIPQTHGGETVKKKKVNIKQRGKGKWFIATHRKATINGVEKGNRRLFAISQRSAA